MLGISVYAGMDNSIEEIIEYLNKAHKFGIQTLFTSAHIPETNENFLNDLRILLEESSRLGFTTIIDISKNYFEKLDMNKYKIDYLRLDYGFTLEEAAKMTNECDFGITVNATTFTTEDIEKFIGFGGKIEKINACHNFYPRKDTGISEELFIKRNKIFKKYGIKTMAFVPSQDGKRGPVYEGLPTLEKHRDLPPIVSSQHLLKLGIDFVVIGDAIASDEELKSLNVIENDINIIPIKLNENLSEVELKLLNSVHTNRMDPGEYAIRSQESRLIKEGQIIPNNNLFPRSKYSVTIDNERYKRYEGELQILKKDLPVDERVNVVGDVKFGDVIIDLLRPGEKFKFYTMGD
ncbi:MupG family TIM beta-alpha barrel fold protein [Anaerosalibacter massiliensis]|uniref:MupG family TIM beta-alpha barrel fold protein n=1 Tax=Anaerosalibacter massiliensis TaxID=1347392 RepID=A0A9X2ML88_9FIRM|nr:MupG family TIM beta-alpha barrel fold protein [Anaerosalibacter massiliensis]MCR2045207.1 MupG family TIM beta-alpha barrel fold protein [Anaerosalibacter massiliensis]